jgi:hypothetical protein
MSIGTFHEHHFCRWCSKPYTTKKPLLKDGFCCLACKQAHYRAYKSYVTCSARYRQRAAERGVTHKKVKK